MLAREARKPFDLGHAPFITVSVAALSRSRHLLVLNLHHAAMDGWYVMGCIMELCFGFNIMCSDDMHHFSTATDPWQPTCRSMGRVWQEILLFYYAAVHGSTPDLPPLELQYADFSAWEQAQLEEGSESLDNMVSYWRKNMRSSPAMLQLPVDKPRPAVASGAPTEYGSVDIDDATTATLKRLASGLGISLYALFIAAYR